MLLGFFVGLAIGLVVGGALQWTIDLREEYRR